MKTRETTYVDLRKNPPKINKGNISGGPKDVAAVMVGAIVDMMYPEKIYAIVSNSGHTIRLRIYESHMWSHCWLVGSTV